ncbi:MAG TPA: methyl-accepting chemotaxis protein [Pseudoxanthomonas sp.]|nr:methyl-accepting chemotaxis protein [Pseudoxanthomonas sp.]
MSPARPTRLRPSELLSRFRRLAAQARARAARLGRLAPARLARMGLAGKIQASLLVCGAGLLVIALAYWRASAGTGEAAATFAAHQDYAALAARMAQQVSEARRLQTAYAHSLRPEDRQALQEVQRRLAQTLERLRANARDEDGAAVDEVAVRVGRFAEGIASLNARVDEMGSGEAGLLAQLESAARELEAQVEAQPVPALSAQLQRMRRDEALFLLGGDTQHADRVSEAKLPFDLALGAARVPPAAQDAIRTAMDAYQAALLAYVAARVGLDVEAQSLESAAADIAPALAQLDAAQARALESARARQRAQARWMDGFFAVTLLLVSAVLLAVLLMVLRAVRRPIEQALAFAGAIAEGRLDAPLAVHNPHDEIGRLARMLGHMRDRLRERIEAERAAARENGRARQALDSARTGLLVLDQDGNVAYANRALLDALDVADAAALAGVPAARLHPAFDAIARRMDAGEARVEEEIAHGGVRYRLAASAVVVDGQRIGAAVEWRSRALELTVENEIAALVDAAARGELHGRIGLDGKEGFVRTLSVSINRLLETFEHKLAALQSLLAALSRGDLGARMEGEFHGTFARIRDDANATVAQLTAIVAGIQEAAVAVNAAAAGIASGNRDLARRTEQQAAALEQTSAAVDALAGTVRQNAEAARQANRLAIGAAEVAARGGEAVGRVVATMRGIEHASRRITEIVALIDGIAFQTSILALNAAVEAARAGEHGRGFAVVAAEVRSLAQRSAVAAGEIKSLIEGTVAQVDDGARLVDQAGATMEEIQASVRSVTGIMAGIEDASQAQNEGIERIGQAVVRMDRATEQNAALVEEAAAAAGAMQEQAAALSASVAVFRMAGDARHAAAPERPHAHAPRRAPGAAVPLRTVQRELS